MTIHIKDLEIDVIIGILKHEREIPQRLIINLEASYKYTQGRSFVNYADMVDIITNELSSKQYGLLEEALLGLKNKIRDNFPQVDKLFIELTKPDILTNCNVGISQNWIF
ncbi:MAG: dihydroneopterin aldolase [Sulfurovaceae bacterium]|nr:dihydroneopterin aldolase [Sulfurovaceae bacterium]